MALNVANLRKRELKAEEKFEKNLMGKDLLIQAKNKSAEKSHLFNKK